MMKKRLRGYGLSINGASAGALLIFLVLCLGTGLSTISNLPDPVERISALGELGGQKAFAGEQGIKEAMVDSQLYNDTLIVVDTTAAPGSSFWLTVNLTNKTIPVTGFGFMLTYKPSIIYPETVWTNPCPDSLCTLIVIRGYKTERTEGPFTEPFVWTGRTENNHIDTLRFNALVDYFLDPIPYLPNPGSGPVVRFKFFVRPDVEPGVKDTIRFLYWDPSSPPPGNYASTLTDIPGEHNFIPRTRNGVFTVSEGVGPGENHCPVFTAPPTESFSVNQGTTLEFYVTATDADGDTITLSLDPLDLAGRTSWNFDTIKGKGLVTQKFSYTPGFDESPGFKDIRFIAVDDSGCSVPKYVTIQVIETEQDLLMASILQGGVPGSADRMVPFLITNKTDIYGFQFTFRWDHTKLAVDSIMRTSVIDGFSMYTNLGDSAGKATVLVFGLSGQKIPAGLDTVIYPAFRVFEDASPGGVDILLENAREAINPGYPSQPLGVVNGLFMIDMFGDANLDQMVDVGDVVSLVAYINEDISFTSRQESAADVNRDLDINVADLVAMIDIILGTWMGPSPPMYPGPMAFVRLDYQELQAGSSGDVKVMADLEVPVAGAQLQINYDPNEILFQTPRLSERSDHFLMEYRDNGRGKLTVLLYNMSNEPIPVGEGNILSLPAILSPGAGDDLNIELKEVVLADQKAALIPVGDQAPSVPVAFELSQNYPNPFNPSTTIKFTLPSQQEGPAAWPTTLKIYNVLGEVVRTLVDEPMTPGVHHQVWDGKDEGGNQVASGIYFYRLRSGDFTDTKKMVLMK